MLGEYVHFLTDIFHRHCGFFLWFYECPGEALSRVQVRCTSSSLSLSIYDLGICTDAGSQLVCLAYMYVY